MTNIDFKTKGDVQALSAYKPNLKYADFGTMGKTAFRSSAVASFTQTKKKVGLQQPELPDPRRETTEQFYVANGKRLKAPTASVRKRTTQLEADKWNDNVFTGDTANFQADLTGKARKRVLKFEQSQAGKHKIAGLSGTEITKTQRDKSKNQVESDQRPKSDVQVIRGTTFSKIDANAAADQETQLVRLDHRKTLEGKVNLKKVRDIRRAIRRRYANRKHASKLFQAWDRKHNRKIDEEDIMEMVNKIGIRINKNEAKVLLTSADIDGDGHLNIEEFIGLIHSDNEALDLDLRKITEANNEINTKHKNTLEIEQRLQQGVSNAYENKLDNQIRFFMQKSCQTIARDCLNEDQEVGGEKTYQIDKKKLKTILKHRLKLPEMLKNDDFRIDKIIDEYTTGHNSDAVDYRYMMEDLRTFSYNIEAASGAATSRRKPSPREDSEISDQYEDENAQFTILDIQKVPFSKENEIKNRSSKLNRMLKKKFQTEAALNHHLKNKIDIDKNGTIDLNEFKTLIISTFKKEIEDSSVSKKDIEAFLSSFVYNKYGHTAVEELAPRIFASAEEYNRIIDHFRRPKPPPSGVNAGLNLSENENIKDKFYQQRIKILADKIVSKALDSSHSKYNCFKMFDKDDDGYISYKDFTDKVKEMEIPASNDEILSVIKIIDTGKNGFIDFREFMQHFTPNMPEIMESNLPYLKNKKLIGSVNGNIAPNRELVQNQMNK